MKGGQIDLPQKKLPSKSPVLVGLTNFEIQKYYLNDVYSRNSSLKIKDRAYVIYLYECKSVGKLGIVFVCFVCEWW